jgi:hypothetical protein
MTVYKIWENEGSIDTFFPHFMEHKAQKWKDYRKNPLDKIIKFKRLSHIWQGIAIKGLIYKAIKNKTLSSVPIDSGKLNDIAYNKAFNCLMEARY